MAGDLCSLTTILRLLKAQQRILCSFESSTSLHRAAWAADDRAFALDLELWHAAGIKVDKGLAPLPNSNGESWCQGLDGLAQRTAEYYKAGARFAKWRSVVSIPSGPSRLAVTDCAYGLARYAAIAQVRTVLMTRKEHFGGSCCLGCLHCGS